jgi:hypothetical protein
LAIKCVAMYVVYHRLLCLIESASYACLWRGISKGMSSYVSPSIRLLYITVAAWRFGNTMIPRQAARPML